MIKLEDLRKSIEQYLQDSDIYIVDIKIKAGNNITVLIDRDTDINIDDCIALTRFIESKYDRDADDYHLTVSSPGVGQPLRLLRQYNKVIGKEVEIQFSDKSNLKGTLVAADNEKITVKLVSKVKKEVTEQLREIPYSELTSVKEVISFR